MDLQLAIILVLTAVIHFIGTCAYAFRIAAVRTGQVAVAFSLFNILVLVSRTSNSFQAPFIAKRVENALIDPASHSLQHDFRLILLAATLATFAAGLLIPTLQRAATASVSAFKRYRSVMRMLWAGCGRTGFRALRSSLAAPSIGSLALLRPGKDIPIGMILLNVGANALWTVGVLSSIYAGYMFPEFRLTASSLSAVINGLATIFLFVVLDPYIAITTDDAVRNRSGGPSTEASFRRLIVWMILTRLLGTLAAQVLLLPCARLIALTAGAI